MKDDWFLPEKLSAQEQQSRGKDGLGDFGSYARVNRTGTLADSEIEGHNLVFADARVRLYVQMLPLRAYGAIADMGCGLGLTTGALAAAFPQAKVSGYDISHDAIEYGARTYPAASFRQFAIAPDTDFGATFDLILCQEFYAFTRTADWAVQSAYIDGFLAHLNPGGVLAIELSERNAEGTVLVNRRALAARGAIFKRMPYDRVFRTLPVSGAANLCSWVLERCMGVDRNLLILLQRALST